MPEKVVFSIEICSCRCWIKTTTEAKCCSIPSPVRPCLLNCNKCRPGPINLCPGVKNVNFFGYALWRVPPSWTHSFCTYVLFWQLNYISILTSSKIFQPVFFLATFSGNLLTRYTENVFLRTHTHDAQKILEFLPPPLPIFVLVSPRKREIEGPCCSPRPPPYLKGRGGGGQGQTRAVPHILHIVYTLLWSPYMVKPQDLLLRVFKKPKFFCLHRVVF